MEKIFNGFFVEIFPSVFAFVVVMGIAIIGGTVIWIKDKLYEKKADNKKSNQVCSF